VCEREKESERKRGGRKRYSVYLCALGDKNSLDAYEDNMCVCVCVCMYVSE
jgi:hypothetical protein